MSIKAVKSIFRSITPSVDEKNIVRVKKTEATATPLVAEFAPPYEVSRRETTEQCCEPHSSGVRGGRSVESTKQKGHREGG